MQENRKQSFIILSLLLALGAGLRWHKLDRGLGGGDEAGMLLHYGYLPLNHILTQYFEASNHIFHTILTHLMIMAFGEDNEIAIRFPVFAFGVACLWMIYKTAYALFPSPAVSRLALLLTAISPIHIYYSHTARGYSLIMFFSTAMIYAAVKLLGSPKPLLWGTVLTVCGFLSVYTLPTNIYFVAGLAAWMLAVLLIPAWNREFGWDIAAKRKKIVTFLTVFAVMGILTFWVYFPLLDQMIKVARYDISYAKNMYGASPNPLSAILLSIIPNILVLIFDKNLWVLPLLLAGFFGGRVGRNSYRWLPVCVFLIPMMVPVFTGVSGYPRNYLYNLPLLVIFLAGGIIRTGELLKKRLQPQYLVFGVVIVFTLISAQTLFFKHYPSLEIPNAKLLRQELKKNIDPLDLVIICDTKNYLYNQTVYKANLKNIVLLNKISGFKMLAADTSDIKNYKAFDGIRDFLPFADLNVTTLAGKKLVDDALNLYSLADSKPFFSLPEDFETRSEWKFVNGSGTVSSEKKHKIAGHESLLIKSTSQINFLIQTQLVESLDVKHYVLAVLLYNGYNSTPGLSLSGDRNIIIPTIVVQVDKNKGILQIGKINLGIPVRLPEMPTGPDSFSWVSNAFIGIIPPGQYSLGLQLGVLGEQTVLYDGLRLFLFEVPGFDK